MKLLFTNKLRDFCEKHPDSQKSIENWVHIAKKCNWKNPHEVKNTLSDVSILKNNRIVFNIKRNDYRLVVVIKFSLSAVYIRWVGKHSDYDKIDANTI